MDLVGIRTVVTLMLGRPGSPGLGGVINGSRHRPRFDWLGRRRPTGTVSDGESDLVSRQQLRSPTGAVTGLVDLEVEVGVQHQGHRTASRSDLPSRPTDDWSRQHILGAGDELDLDVHPSPDTAGISQEHVWRVPAEIVSADSGRHGQCIRQDQLSVVANEPCFEDQTFRSIDARHVRDTRWSYREMAGTIIEEAGEHRRAVEPGDTPPNH